ncbi:MAG TPA: tRNA (adenosine(37)-N6)-threonylcarbamoyltransferase complex ATPase subunit type 1 TsaE [Firmicutes bacterium]|nr:tRNA (adenosine(37)-N6)-threonylcarbamoyltransferase complex ATPase subunit type 1 TsaE [Bacillota bacterium]
MVRTLEHRISTVTTESADGTRRLGRAIGEHLEGSEIIVLAGPLGAGKTVMVQGMAQGLGISRSVSSPSFVLEKIYQGSLILHHFDFYRLNREEVIESGLLLDLDPRSVAVIEWAERAGDAVPDWTLKITLEFDAGAMGPGLPDAIEKRIITLESATARWGEIVEYAIQKCKEDK